MLSDALQNHPDSVTDIPLLVSAFLDGQMATAAAAANGDREKLVSADDCSAAKVVYQPP
jgi:hypothetical protein